MATQRTSVNSTKPRPQVRDQSRAAKSQSSKTIIRKNSDEKTEKIQNPTKQILKFAFLPEIGKSLEGIKSAFGILINTVAQLFVMVKLIPADHPSTDLRNARDYKLTQILTIAYKNIVWDRKNFPQIVLFFAVLGFLLFMVLSVLTILMQILSGSAFADTPGTPINVGGAVLNTMFNLDNAGTIPAALGAMLRVYSNGMLVLGGIVLIYIVIGKVLDTASTGTPFGKNFSHTWGPIRLVVAIGLLVPLSSGLNSGQYIVIYLAKWGSNLASETFDHFSGFVANGHDMSFEPIDAGISSTIVYDLFDAEACVIAKAKGAGTLITPHFTHNDTSTTILYKDETAGEHTCGTFSFDHDPKYKANYESVTSSGITEPVEMVKFAKYKYFLTMRNQAQILADKLQSHIYPSDASGNNSAKYFSTIPKSDYLTDLTNMFGSYKANVQKTTDQANTRNKELLNGNLLQNMRSVGWIGAGMWIQEIAKRNSELQDAVNNKPNASVDSSNSDFLRGLSELSGQNVVPDTGAAMTDSSRVINNNNSGILGSAEGLVSNKVNQIFLRAFDWVGTLGVRAFSRVILDNPNPYQGLVAIGNLLLTLSISSFTTVILLFGSSTANIFGNGIGPGLAIIAGPIVTFFIGILFTSGIVLSILLPMLPTLRFFSGVLGWILLVFMAILAMPLVALAHLKMDGDGLPGQMAQGAYMMIAGIILRPLFIIFGLVVGFIAFNTICKVLGLLFLPATEIALTTVGPGGVGSMAGGIIGGMGNPLAGGIGFTLGYVVKTIFSTFMLATFTIALANSCFKMIDIVPDRIMTWIGGAALNSGTEDDTQQTYAAVGAAGLKALGSAQHLSAPQTIDAIDQMKKERSGRGTSLGGKPTKLADNQKQFPGSGPGETSVGPGSPDGSTSIEAGTNSNNGESSFKFADENDSSPTGNDGSTQGSAALPAPASDSGNSAATSISASGSETPQTNFNAANNTGAINSSASISGNVVNANSENGSVSGQNEVAGTFASQRAAKMASANGNSTSATRTNNNTVSAVETTADDAPATETANNAAPATGIVKNNTAPPAETTDSPAAGTTNNNATTTAETKKSRKVPEGSFNRIAARGAHVAFSLAITPAGSALVMGAYKMAQKKMAQGKDKELEKIPTNES